MHLKKTVWIICSVFLLGCEASFSDIQRVQIDEQMWHVELAQTHEERQQGLMERESLSEDAGMLFIFEKEAHYPFWMKNTLIPLDIIWISEEKKVVDVQTARPCEQDRCPHYRPRANAKFVLEILGESFEGQVGDEVEFK